MPQETSCVLFTKINKNAHIVYNNKQIEWRAI